MMRSIVRLSGTLMMVAGAGALVWALVVWRWEDPFTALYTHYEQRQLASALDKRISEFKPTKHAGAVDLASERREIAAGARRYRRMSHRGEAIGRLRVPRLGLNIIVVNGTDHDSLKRGPGRDLRTFMPGEGELIYVAGHRTTYLAPFSHIDSLRPGDRIWFEVPYATFVYRVSGHRIVSADDLSVLRSHHREVLVLQACHPRFFASHRYLAYARPVRVIPRGGAAYTPAEQLAAAR